MIRLESRLCRLICQPSRVDPSYSRVSEAGTDGSLYSSIILSDITGGLGSHSRVVWTMWKLRSLGKLQGETALRSSYLPLYYLTMMALVQSIDSSSVATSIGEWSDSSVKQLYHKTPVPFAVHANEGSESS